MSNPWTQALLAGVCILFPTQGNLIVFKNNLWTNQSLLTDGTTIVGDGIIVPLSCPSPLFTAPVSPFTDVSIEVVAMTMHGTANLIPNNGTISPSWNNVYTPSLGSYVLSSGVYTCGQQGVYTIYANTQFPANATGYRTCGVIAVIGGVSRTLFEDANSNPATLTTFAGSSATLYLNVGDNLTPYCFQNSGGGLSVSFRVGVSFLHL